MFDFFIIFYGFSGRTAYRDRVFCLIPSIILLSSVILHVGAVQYDLVTN
jgi:hypothetical protein